MMILTFQGKILKTKTKTNYRMLRKYIKQNLIHKKAEICQETDCNDMVISTWGMP